jgi:hypothetical protein
MVEKLLARDTGNLFLKLVLLEAPRHPRRQEPSASVRFFLSANRGPNWNAGLLSHYWPRKVSWPSMVTVPLLQTATVTLPVWRAQCPFLSHHSFASLALEILCRMAHITSRPAQSRAIPVFPNLPVCLVLSRFRTRGESIDRVRIRASDAHGDFGTRMVIFQNFS